RREQEQAPLFNWLEENKNKLHCSTGLKRTRTSSTVPLVRREQEQAPLFYWLEENKNKLHCSTS
ncbi:hypothetical protein BgiMline_009140, partial [Biomphalaria glabrata]